MQVKGPVVLLVEDNVTLRSTLRCYLDRRLPVQLLEAASAAEALALTRRYDPDVILLDLSLPDQPGLTAIAPLREGRPSRRIIVMASQPEQQHGEAAARAGAWACIPKDALGSQLEPLLWRALPSGNLSLAARCTRWQQIARASRFGRVERSLAGALALVGQGTRWLDAHGPWSGKPRTRLLYLANVMELALVLVVQQHALGI